MGGRGSSFGGGGGGNSSYNVPIGKKVDFYKALNVGNGKIKYVKATGETFSSEGRTFAIEKKIYSGYPSYDVTDTKTGMFVSRDNRTRKAAINSVSNFNSRLANESSGRKSLIASYEKSMQKYYSKIKKKKK